MILNPSEIFGLWSIWQPSGYGAIESMIQQGFSKAAGGFGKAFGDDVDCETDRCDYEVVGGTAILPLIGPLMKYDASWFGGTSMTYTQRCLAMALGDDRVNSILLLCDSPGGTVSGTKDLADAVSAAAQQKPVYAYIQDMGCSAAYWIASQATKVYANSMAVIGSIGVLHVVTDYSAAAEMQGWKVFLVKTGEFKGAGTPGTKITPEQLAERQVLVDGMGEQFITNAARGRRMALRNMKTLADGRAHMAETALEMGFIDGIQSLDTTLLQLPKARARPRGAKATWDAETGAWSDDLEISADAEPSVTSDAAEAAINLEGIETMSESAPETPVAPVAPVVETPAPVAPVAPVVEAPAAPVAATLTELKDACPGASADFIVAQMEAGATASLAGKAWTAKLTEQLAAQAAELAAAKAAPVVGVETLGDGSKGAPVALDAITAFEALIKEYTAKFADRAVAMQKLVAEHAGEHAAYLAAYSAAHAYTGR